MKRCPSCIKPINGYPRRKDKVLQPLFGKMADSIYPMGNRTAFMPNAASMAKSSAVTQFSL